MKLVIVFFDGQPRRTETIAKKVEPTYDPAYEGFVRVR